LGQLNEGISRLNFDLIIFDCDGVLVDSEPIVNRVFVEMLEELGFTLDFEGSLREFAGSSMSNRLRVTQQRLGWVAPQDFSSHFDRRLNKVMESELRPVPGVAEVLGKLSLPWCVASNGGQEDMRFRLQKAGLLRWFDGKMFSASEVSEGKPAPDIFVHVAKRMGVEPSRCAVIEDSLPGVQAGVAAGMVVFGYARLTSHQTLQKAGARVFEGMTELPRLLEAIAV
jgi:HAD superfamily hydrolase (TIGR01509 family)